MLAIKARLADLRGQVDGIWTGDAARTYKLVVDEWSPQFDAVLQSLDRLGTKLQASHITYQNAQSSASDLTNQLKAALGGNEASVV
jgi:uncharacterized protein YukE